MRKIIALTAAVGMLGASAAMAQTTSPTQTQPQTPQQKTQPPVGVPPSPQAQTPSPGTSTTTTTPSASQKGAFLSQQQSGQMLASDMMKMNIMGTNNERIGEVDDLLVDQDGKIVAALVGVGGFLGIGEKSVAIPFDAIQHSGDRLTVQYSRQELENAPTFVTAKSSTRGTGTSGGGTGMGTGTGSTQQR